MKELSVTEAQGLLLEALKVIDSICRGHNIKYWLEGGTLLGAVRHGRFIGWDDDIDLCMSRDDFERFALVCRERLPRHLVLVTQKHRPLAVHAKVAIPEVRTVNEYAARHGMPSEDFLAIDITAMDPLPSNSVLRTAAQLLRLAAGLKPWAGPMCRAAKWREPLRKMRWGLIALAPRSLALWFQRWAQQASTRIADPRWFGYGYGHGSGTETFPADCIFPLRMIQFEGQGFSAPADPARYLTIMYGKDYLIPPPVDQRRSHFSTIHYTS